MKLVSVKPAKDKVHKYVAEFQLDDGSLKHVRFGAYGMDDFTKTKDEEQKKRYLMRHKAKEDWNNPVSPGALANWLLWNKPPFLVPFPSLVNGFHFNSWLLFRFFS